MESSWNLAFRLIWCLSAKKLVQISQVLSRTGDIHRSFSEEWCWNISILRYSSKSFFLKWKIASILLQANSRPLRINQRICKALVVQNLQSTPPSNNVLRFFQYPNPGKCRWDTEIVHKSVISHGLSTKKGKWYLSWLQKRKVISVVVTKKG